MNVYITKSFELTINKLIPLCSKEQLNYLMPILQDIQYQRGLNLFYKIMLSPIDIENNIYILKNEYNLEIIVTLKDNDYYFSNIKLVD